MLFLWILAFTIHKTLLVVMGCVVFLYRSYLYLTHCNRTVSSFNIQSNKSGISSKLDFYPIISKQLHDGFNGYTEQYHARQLLRYHLIKYTSSYVRLLQLHLMTISQHKQQTAKQHTTIIIRPRWMRLLMALTYAVSHTNLLTTIYSVLALSSHHYDLGFMVFECGSERRTTELRKWIKRNIGDTQHYSTSA
ncbi:hypothetical protein BC941DRAFT_466612 [Chlamydoabsidia padenii]|nr:hypothetical protein BC941DRAFT_466612 [Chlamydoabsidia padenii]